MADFTPVGIEAVVKGLDSFSRGMSTMGKDIDGVGEKAGGLGKVFGTVGKAALALGAAAVAATAAGILIIGKGLADCVSEAIESQEALAKVEAVIKSTGGAAGITAEEANALASQFQAVTRYSDEMVLSAEAVLLRFKGIGEDVFPQALELSLDLATALGTDVTSAATMLGKALEAPGEGLMRLKAAGVVFTDEQEAMITKMVEAGDVAGAQKLIMDSLATSVGGAATEAGKTFAGQWEILNNQFSDVKESIGMALLPILSQLIDNVIKPAIPIIQDLAAQFVAWVQSPAFGEGVTNLISTLQGIWAWISENLIPAFSTIAGWLSTNIPSAIDTVSGFWNDVLLPAITAVVGWITDNLVPILADIVAWLATNIPAAVDTVVGFWNNVLLPALQTVGQWISENLMPVLNQVATFWGTIITGAIDAFIPFWNDTLWPALQTVGQWISDTLIPILGDIASWIGTVIVGAIEGYLALWNDVFLPALQGVATWIADTLLPTFANIATWFVESATKIGGWITDTWTKLSEAFTGVSNFVTNTLVPAFISIISWMTENTEPLKAFVTDVIDKIAQGWNGVVTAIGSVITFLGNLLLWIQTNWEKIKSVLADIWPGSPSKLEISFLGIASAVDTLTQSLKEMGDAINPGGPVEQGLKSLSELIEGLSGSMSEGGESPLEAILKLGGGFSAFGGALSGRYQKKVIDPLEDQLKGFQEAFNNLSDEEELINKRYAGRTEDIMGAGSQYDKYINDIQRRLAGGGETGQQLRLMYELEKYLGLRDEEKEKLLADLKVQKAEELMRIEKERAALAERQTKAQEEYAAAQQHILDLQEKQADLAFLQSQMDFLKFMQENGLDPEAILGGLELGLGASLPDLIDAMTRAMEEVIAAANEELGIGSPSRVFRGIGMQVMAGLTQGIGGLVGAPMEAMRAAAAGLTSAAQMAMPALAPAYGGAGGHTVNVNISGTSINNGMDWATFKASVKNTVKEAMRYG